jgi:hypothetical protein
MIFIMKSICSLPSRGDDDYLNRSALLAKIIVGSRPYI